MKIRKRKIRLGRRGQIIAIAALVTLAAWRYAAARQGGRTESVNYDALPAYSAAELSQHNGEQPDRPVLLALDGYIYDVSAGRDDFYAPGKPYHYLAGRDSSQELHLAGGEIIRNKYPIVGKFRP